MTYQIMERAGVFELKAYEDGKLILLYYARSEQEATRVVQAVIRYRR